MAYQDPHDCGDLAALFAGVGVALLAWVLMWIIASGLRIAATAGG